MTQKLKALLVDDERPARKWLRELLLVHPELDIIGEADSVASAVEFVKREAPDIIFLDVQMPPGSGFEVLPHLNPGVRVVFVTAYDTFAVKAFEANALDYLLKPVHPERLAETVRRLGATPESPQPPSQPESLDLDDLVPLQDRGTLRMVVTHDIAAIEAEAAYSRVWIRQQDTILILRSLKEWENILPTPPFFRVDRSLLVQINLIEKVESQNRNEALVFLKDISKPLVIGRSASARLKKLLKD